MNPLELFKSFQGLYDIIKTLPQSEGFKYTLFYLFRGSPLLLRLCTLVALLSGLSFGYVSYLNLTEANSSLVSALTSPWDKSELPHSGLEAFLVTSLLSDDDWRGLEALYSAKVRPSFKDGVQRLQSSLSTPTLELPISLDAVQIPFRHTDPGGDIFLSDRNQGFLFVPGIQLSDAAALEKRVKPQTLETVLGQDPSEADRRPPQILNPRDEPSIFMDILLSQRVATQLCGGDEPRRATIRDLNSGDAGPVFESEPNILSFHFSQTYLIFQSGVARLCESGIASDYWDQRKFYGVRFKPYTLLQDRPYFQGTLARPPSSYDMSVGEYFFESGPYMDIAGNGIVDTFCRSLPVLSSIKKEMHQSLSTPYQTDAILCVDFNLKKNLSSSLVPRIARYGGTAAIIGCDENHCAKQGEPEKPSWFSRDRLLSVFFSGEPVKDEDIAFVEEKYRELKRASSTSEILGRVGTFPISNSKVLFTVPMGQGRLLMGKLDLTAYQARTFLFLILAGSALSAMVVLLFMGFADYGLKFKEQQRAFEAVDTVMTDIKWPFMRVDEDGHLTHMNDAAANALGFSSTSAAVTLLRNVTFEEMLADDASMNEYKKIKEERAEGKPYRKYRVNIWTGGAPGRGPAKPFDVHGWNVPTPRPASGKPGQSFGILIPAGDTVSSQGEAFGMG